MVLVLMMLLLAPAPHMIVGLERKAASSAL
jgi:hypothetical protein